MPTEYDTRRQRWITVVNDTTEYVPAYAAVQITGIIPLNSTTYPNHSGEFLIGKPTRDNRTTGILFNSGAPIPPKGTGMATAEFPTVMAYEVDPDAGSGSTPDSHPVADDSLGVQANDWLLLKGNIGFQSLCTGRAIDSLTGITAGTIHATSSGVATVREDLGLCWVPCTDTGGSTPITPSNAIVVGYRIYENGTTPPSYTSLTALFCLNGEWQLSDFTFNAPDGIGIGLSANRGYLFSGGGDLYRFDFDSSVPANPCDGFTVTGVSNTAGSPPEGKVWKLDITVAAQDCSCSVTPADGLCINGYKLVRKMRNLNPATGVQVGDTWCESVTTCDENFCDPPTLPPPSSDAPTPGQVVSGSCCEGTLPKYWKFSLSNINFTSTPAISLASESCCNMWEGTWYLEGWSFGLGVGGSSCGVWTANDSFAGATIAIYGVTPGDWNCFNGLYNAFGAGGHNKRYVNLSMKGPVSIGGGQYTYAFSLTFQSFPTSNHSYAQNWAVYEKTVTVTDNGSGDPDCPNGPITLDIVPGVYGLGGNEPRVSCTFPATITIEEW